MFYYYWFINHASSYGVDQFFGQSFCKQKHKHSSFNLNIVQKQLSMKLSDSQKDAFAGYGQIDHNYQQQKKACIQYLIVVFTKLHKPQQKQIRFNTSISPQVISLFHMLNILNRFSVQILSFYASLPLQQIINLYAMHPNTLLSRATSPTRQIRSESKQQFFAIKKNTKRLKISNIFSQSAEVLEESLAKNQQSDYRNEDLLSNIKDRKLELASTICSDHYLTFRSKQPKRKKNKHSKTPNDPAEAQSSASENEAPSIPSPRNHPNLKSNLPQDQQIRKSKFSADSFVFITKIGQGTYSQVFKAIQKATGFVCSLKMLNKQKMRSLKVEQNIFREIKIHSFVNHPHITKLYGFFDDQKFIYLICEYATDENVYENLSRNKAQGRMGLPLDRASLFVGQITSAISYMHSNYIIHRDIKPENMIITFSDTIKMCDFGWSIYNPDKEMRSTMCGTPLYLAPQLIKQDNYNESVDVWALGILTYELLTNEIPFKIRSIKDLKKVVSTQIKFTKIKCKQAVQFIENALKKKHQERHDIHELFGHPFLKYYHQQSHM